LFVDDSGEGKNHEYNGRNEVDAMSGKANGKSRKLKPGDIVEIEWYDTHGLERLSMDEIAELDDPEATVAYGIVLRNGSRYLTIASELCTDLSSDGNYLEQIPHGTIQRIRILGRRIISFEVS
jgi:hypothetical protein